MSLVLGYDQFNGSTVTTGLANLPAGAALLKARLAAYTFVNGVRTDGLIDEAPPNTILGISWVPHGTSVPLITTANWKTSTWIVAGPGELTAMDRWCVVFRDVTPNQVNLQHVYSNFIEIEFPFVSAAAMDLGISINFLGGGFFGGATPWVSYQFSAYFD